MDKLPCVTAKSIEILQKTLKTQENNPLHQTSLNSPNPEKKTHTKRRQRQIHKTLQCTISAYVCIFCMRWSTKDVFHKMQVCICLCVSVCCMAKTTTTKKNTKHEHTCLNLCFPRVWFFNLCKHGDGSLHHAVSHCCALCPLSVLCVMDDREGK